MWFDEVMESEHPSRPELQGFVHGVRGFLNFVLMNDDFRFLWSETSSLLDMARETFMYDIAEGAGLELDRAIFEISDSALVSHGLIGRPLRFKFQVLRSIENQWEHTGELRDQLRDPLGRFRKKFSIREWFRKMVEAIDAILDSIIDAAHGAGGLIKEFKDALMALA